MIKKLLIALGVALSSLLVTAQSVGTWQVYPSYSNNVDKIEDGNDKVYYITAGSLYSYDESDGELYAYLPTNKLNDSKVSDIYYNSDKGYLLVIYSNSNMDVLYDDGHVVNLPEIKDINLTTGKKITDVAFAGGRIYIATAFGIVIYDDEKMQVIESGNYGKEIPAIDVLGDDILIKVDYSIYVSPISIRHNNLSKFELLFGSMCEDFATLNDNQLVLYNTSNKLMYLTTVTKNNGVYTVEHDTSTLTAPTGAISKLVPAADALYSTDGDNLYRIDRATPAVSSVVLTDAIKGRAVATRSGFGKVWASTADGVGAYDLSTAEANVLVTPYRPVAFSVTNTGQIIFSNDGSTMYVMETPSSSYRTNRKGVDTYWIAAVMDMKQGDKITDIAPLEVTALHDGGKDPQNKNGDKLMYGGNARLAVDPTDPEKIYVANNFEGLYVLKNGKELGHFGIMNSLICNSWFGARAHDVIFDPEGNLWVGSLTPETYCVLPAAKVNGDLSKVTTDDWIAMKMDKTFAAAKDYRSVFVGNTGILVYTSGKFWGGLAVRDTKCTYTNPGDDVVAVFESFVDQDGNTFKPEYVTSLVVDKRGRVWAGTSMGVFEITNPRNATNPSMTINRIKVPRNDGTNYADYLCESDMVYDLAVDASNRKWIVTESSGIYLVSENGDKILEHFTVDNSPLPTNQVYNVCCDPLSNVVYFGTSAGVMSYNGTSAPAHDDYNDVLAYPNPVRPEYRGPVTISGLMENSLVKIGDAQGNIFFNGRSEGGMITWDLSNGSGKRVPSGVYYVFASQNEDGSSSGVVTKILVIN